MAPLKLLPHSPPQEGGMDYSSELQQLQNEADMPLDQLLDTLPPEILGSGDFPTPAHSEGEEEDMDVGGGKGVETLVVEEPKQKKRTRYYNTLYAVCDESLVVWLLRYSNCALYKLITQCLQSCTVQAVCLQLYMAQHTHTHVYCTYIHVGLYSCTVYM